MSWRHFAIGIFIATVCLTARARDEHKPAGCLWTPCVLPATRIPVGSSFANDPTIATNPQNPGDLMVGVAEGQDSNCSNPLGNAFYLSSDGGTSWTTTCMNPLDNAFGRTYWPGGGLVAYDALGNRYVASGYGDSEGLGFSLVAIEKSVDGMTWSAPRIAVGSQNSTVYYSQLSADVNVGSPYENSVYIPSLVLLDLQLPESVIVSRSDNGGENWSDAKLEPPQYSPSDDAYPDLTVGRDGTLYVTWAHCPAHGNYANCDHSTEFIAFSKSADGGATWSQPSLAGTAIGVPNACSCWPFGGIPNTDVGAPDAPVISVDNSDGPFAGRLYVVTYSWTGSYMRVQVIHSTDGGNTWSKPVPVAPPSVTHDQFFPWLSVSPEGLVGVSWLDRRNDPANISYQAYAAISSDGGESFQPNVQLTTAFSNPNNSGIPGYLGDYTGNAWDGPNYFIAAWMDTSNGISSQDYIGGIRLK